MADAARDVQAASAAVGARFANFGERQASALELARLTAAVQELEDARESLAMVIDDAIAARRQTQSVHGGFLKRGHRLCSPIEACM
jgi:hypothetical protein